MNLGINREEAGFLQEVILRFIKSSQYPKALMETYKMLGVDVENILSQLQIIKEIGEMPLTEEEIKETLKRS